MATADRQRDKPPDWYKSFAHLAAHETEGVDYRIHTVDRSPDTLIVAPHGGHIEPTTSAIAAAVAGADLSLYLFEGLRPGRAHCELHITSNRFDEPRAVALAGRATRILSVHGRSWRGDPHGVWLGGLDDTLRAAVQISLERAGFPVRNPGDALHGLGPTNICNRGRTGRGAQLELPRYLRDMLARDTGRMADFTGAIRTAIIQPAL